jgi:glycine cleavage system transcriptional repressor
MRTLLVSIFCPDRPGLIAAIANRLFELGANLGDASFAVLGTGAEFTTLCGVPPHVDEEILREDLARLPELAGAEISVKGFGLESGHAPTARITHVVSVGGGDRPGLVATLAELFAGFKVNIVRMDAQTLPAGGGDGRYVTRFALNIPANSVNACLAAVANTAGELGLTCSWTEENR